MNVDDLLDPAYACFLDEPASEWTLDTLPAIRARIHSGFKPSQATRCEQTWVEAKTDSPPVRVCIYRPQTAPQVDSLPAILYLHGGGFVLGQPEMADDYLDNLAHEHQAVVVAVDYRLAPEHPFPAPLEDCHIALEWLCRESSAQGIDPARIVIMGHSAGGGLAAALALWVRDRGQFQPAGLVMIYPMLDHRTGTPAAPADNPVTGTLSWSRQANRFCWDCMTGAYPMDDEQAYLLSPALATNLKGLPPTFICVGALDLFLEEDVAFALTLARSGVPTEMHVYPGVPHMFDLCPGRQTEQCAWDVNAALRKCTERSPPG